MRIKRKPVKTVKLPDSKIKKISGKYSKARAKDLLSLKFRRKPDKQLLRRTVQASSGRAMDALSIKDPVIRQTVNKNMQIIVSEDANVAQKRKADMSIRKTLGKNAGRFYDVFQQVFYTNKSIVEFLAREMTEGEVQHKTLMN